MSKKGSAEHSMGMSSSAIKYRVLLETSLGITINREEHLGLG